MVKYPNTESRVFVSDQDGRRFVNVTGRCNLDCSFCPEPIDRTSPGRDSRLPYEPGFREIIDAVCGIGNCREVVFAGLGEPTFRLYDILRAARFLRSKGVRIVLYTNGLAARIHGRDIAPDLEDNVDEINVALPAPNASLYNQFCRPGGEGAFQEVLDFIESAREYVPVINIGAVKGLPGIDISSIRELSRELGVGFEEREIARPC